MGYILSKKRVAPTPSPSERNNVEVQASLSVVGPTLRGIEELGSNSDSYLEALTSWLENHDSGDLALDSCSSNMKFLMDKLCGDGKSSTWRPKGMKMNSDGKVVSDWEGINDQAEKAMDAACALTISISSPDHYWVAIPSSDGRNMVIQMAWQKLFNLPQWIEAGGSTPRSKSDVKRNIGLLGSEKQTERFAGLLWFCDPMQDRVRPVVQKKDVTLDVNLFSVSWTPLKTS